MAWLVENKGMKRVNAAILAGIVTWLGGFATVFSFNIWSDVKPLAAIEIFKNATLFDLLDYLTSNIMLPLGGLLIAIFAGWYMATRSTKEELAIKFGFGYTLWQWLVRIVAPSAVIVVFFVQTGIWAWFKGLFD